MIFPERYGPSGRLINRFVVNHSAASGRLLGNTFNAEAEYLPPNAVAFCAGMTTHNNGTCYRTAPGLVPVGDGFSHRHPGVLADGVRQPVTGLSYWINSDGKEGDDDIHSLMNHVDYEWGRALPHSHPNESMLIRGALLPGARDIYRNHAPLIRRNSDYTFDFDSLLEASPEASWTDFQPTAASRLEAGIPARMVVLATDNNAVQAIIGSASEPGVEMRQFGLNPPPPAASLDLSIVDFNLSCVPIEVATRTPIGPQLKLRLASGSAGSGPADFTADPDAEWEIVNGTEIEIDTGLPPSVLTKNAQADSRLFLASPVKSGTLNSGTWNFLGTATDQESGEPIYSASNGDDAVTWDGVSVATNAAGDPSSSYLQVKWSKEYVSARYYRRDNENASFPYPRVRFVTGDAGMLTRLVAHRAGRPISSEGVKTGWHHAYLFERRDGSYRIRGGHSGDYNQFVTRAPAGYNLSFSNFSQPYQGEAPTHIALCLRAFDPQRPEEEIDDSNGIAPSFTVVATFPIQIDDPDANTWKANNGWDAIHDQPLQECVIDNWLDDIEIALNVDKVVGQGITLGGCSGVVAMAGRILAYAFPKRALAEVSFAPGSTIVQSTKDRFRGFFGGRELVFRGKSYVIRRVIRENLNLDPSFTAALELLEPYEGSAAASGPGFLAPKLDTIRMTVNDGPYGEISPLSWEWQVPDEIGSIVPLSENEALVFGKRRTYYMEIVPAESGVYTEEPSPPIVRVALESENAGAAGPRSFAVVEGGMATDNGLAISLGPNAATMEDITSDANRNLFLKLLNPALSRWRSLAYDQTKGHLLLTNCVTIAPERGRGEATHGVVLDMRAGGAVSLLYPYSARASGTARLARESGSAAFANSGDYYTRWRPGPIVFFVDVSAVGSGGVISQKHAEGSDPDPYVVVYDPAMEEAYRWSAIYVGPSNAEPPNHVVQMEPNLGAADDGEPLPGSHFSIQTADGKLVACYGQIDYLPQAWQETIRLRRASAGGWELDPDQVSLGRQADLGNAVFGMCAVRDGSFYVLSKSQRDPTQDDMGILHYDADSVVIPHETGEGGRFVHVEAGTSDAFTFAGHAAGSKIVPALLALSGGELLIVGYTIASAGGTGTVHLRRYSPKSLQPQGSDLSFTVTDAGAAAENFAGSAPGRGIRAIAANRHQELFLVERKNTDAASGAPLLSLNRYRFPDWGYAGGNAVLLANLDTPEARASLMIDQRDQVWFAVDHDMGGGRLGVRVYMFAESDAQLSWSPTDIGRAGYDRRLVSLVMSGNFAYYLFRDTPTGGGDDEYRLVKAIGVAKRLDSSGNYRFLGDGKPDIVESGGGEQEEDENAGSILFDLADILVGAGGALSYVAVDAQADRATCCLDQANATSAVGNWGLGAL